MYKSIKAGLRKFKSIRYQFSANTVRGVVIQYKMYIKEIILDGFKSYAQKTVVSGFDPQFNAITGNTFH